MCEIIGEKKSESHFLFIVFRWGKIQKKENICKNSNVPKALFLS